MQTDRHMYDPISCQLETVVDWLLEFYILATSKVTSGWWFRTCGSVHSWQLYSDAPLGDEAARTMSWCPTQSHYPGSESTGRCAILIMQSNWFLKVWAHHGIESHDTSKREVDAQFILPSHLVKRNCDTADGVFIVPPLYKPGLLAHILDPISHSGTYPGFDQTSHCPLLLMPSARLDSEMGDNDDINTYIYIYICTSKSIKIYIYIYICIYICVCVKPKKYIFNETT